MLFRRTTAALVAITQPAHAWLAGQLMRAWGNPAFAPPDPWEDVCLAAQQHDMGWLEWESAPELNPATGLPRTFREMPVAAHTAIWARGTDLALALGRYPALLVSLHGTALYTGYDPAEAGKAAIVQRCMAGQGAVQARLAASLRADPFYSPHATDAAIARNQALVRSVDRMSLAVCTLMQDLAVRTEDPAAGLVRAVPATRGTADLTLRALDEATVTVSPWPFAAPTLRVSCEGSLLPGEGFTDEAHMRAALAVAPRVTVEATLRPA